jgi:uncharacterized glyoxalase superfamily protein PhnB
VTVDAAAGSVSATVEVAVRPSEAFRIFTAEIGSWYLVDEHSVMDHRRTVDIRFEPFVGGRLVDVYDAETGEGCEMGRLTAWEPGRRLVFVDARHTETVVSFVPTADGTATAVTVEQRGLDSLPPDEAEHVRRYGWRLLLGWFAATFPGDDEEDQMAQATRSDTTPADVTLQGVSPYLYYEDAGAALDWLARVFGFREVARYVDGDGVVHESEMQVGDTTIQLCGRAPGENEGAGLLLVVHVGDVDAQHARVVGAGVDAPAPEQQPYGPRTFTVVDPWCYRWSFWQHVHDYVAGPGGLREIRS